MLAKDSTQTRAEEALVRNGQKWRTDGGRISVVKQRQGWLARYKGDNGIRRWVGLGVIGDNLISIGNASQRQRTYSSQPAIFAAPARHAARGGIAFAATVPCYPDKHEFCAKEKKFELGDSADPFG